MRASVPVFPPRRQRPVAPSPSPSIWCRLVKTPKSRFALSEPAPLCRDVAQPGRALAWGARGREFKSPRPDHSLLSATPFASASTSQLPTPKQPNLRCSEAEAHQSGLRGALDKAKRHRAISGVQISPSRPFNLIPALNLSKQCTPDCRSTKHSNQGREAEPSPHSTLNNQKGFRLMRISGHDCPRNILV